MRLFMLTGSVDTRVGFGDFHQGVNRGLYFEKMPLGREISELEGFTAHFYRTGNEGARGNV